MLRFAIVFFLIALVAAAFGYGGIAASAAGIGKLLFVGALIVAVVFAGAHVLGGGRSRWLP